MSYWDPTKPPDLRVGLILVTVMLILLAWVVSCGAGRHGLELWVHPPNSKPAKPERQTPCLKSGRYLDPTTMECRPWREPDVAPPQ